jgi:zinc D-Ala-D-Ala carboxypeptidase
MKVFKFPLLVSIAVLALVVAVSFAASGGHRQAQGKTESSVKPVVRVTEKSVAKAAPLTTSAVQNASLRNELTWTFGGKQQRGWYLYDLLIAETLKSNDDPLTNDFVDTLAHWQKKRGVGASGVLDQNTLMSLVSYWQSNRLKNKTYAQPDQLVTAPASDFYDPSRADELRQVDREAYAAYKKMIAAAIADPELKLAPAGKYFKIISSFRSREYQENLRRQSPNSGSAGLAVNSPHFTGRALDIYVGGSPVDTNDANRAIQVNTPAYRWLVRNADRFGFRPYFYEPWHWEYVK